MDSRIFLLISICLVSCTQKPLDPREQLVSSVQGERVYLQEFLTNFNQLRAEQDDTSKKNPKFIEQLKTRAFNELVIVTLLRHEAKKRQIKVPKEEVEGRLANWKDGYPPGGFEEMLRKLNTSEDFLRTRIGDQVLVEKLAQVLFTNESLVSDEETKRYFSQHESEFARAERVHAYQIVVPTQEEAEKIRTDILSGKTTFESAARQHSLSPDAAKGGDIGFFSKNEKIPAFNEAFSLSVGAISKPVQSRYGMHLLRVVEKIPAKRLGYYEAKEDILKSMKRQKEVRAFREWLTKLLKDGEFYRNESLYQKVG